MTRAAPVDARKALRQLAQLDPDAMTLERYRETSDALDQAVRGHKAIKPCCHSCARFESIAGTCDQHGEVPYEFQKAVEQCDDWLHNPIPF